MRQRNLGAQAPDSFTASDLILPSQFFELVGKSRFTSEQRLMLAVLADAINILQDWRGSFSVRKRRLFIDAARWVTARGRNVPFSFDNVCRRSRFALPAYAVAPQGGRTASARNGQPQPPREARERVGSPTRLIAGDAPQATRCLQIGVPSLVLQVSSARFGLI
jgi:hypothetical protein